MVAFIRAQTGYAGDVDGATRLGKDVHLEGDDHHAFMDAFSDTFSVDMRSYLWYFHTEEEGLFSLGKLFFKPPCARVECIDITVAMLYDAASSGIWSLDYPIHTLPRYRYDLLVNAVLGLLMVAVICIVLWSM